MKHLFTLLFIGLLYSCKPDLVLESIEVHPDWNAGMHSVQVTIRNEGNVAANNFLLYTDALAGTDALESIASQNRRLYGSLPAGAVNVITVDYASEVFVYPLSVEDIASIRAMVDAKGDVAESDEANNSMTIAME